MGIGDVLTNLPAQTAGIILQLVSLVIDLIKAGDNEDAQEEALMRGQEAIKKEIDRRRFG